MDKIDNEYISDQELLKLTQTEMEEIANGSTKMSER